MGKEFWVINVSNKNVSLSDLNLTIPAHKYFNLLDKKRFLYTEEFLIRSAEKGSLYKKRDKILKCEGKPEFTINKKLELYNLPVERPIRTAVRTEVKKYDELIYTDEQYADDVSELFKEED